MPANKSQHYVPLCYLRAFCTDPDKASINIFNLKRARSTQAAPVRPQCARDYFYGRDLKLEFSLQIHEGQYGRVLARALNDPELLSEADLLFLHKFMLLQNARTEAKMKQQIVLFELHREILKHENITEELLQNLQVTHEVAVSLTFDVLQAGIAATTHMEHRILSNQTVVPFLTSDDPAIYTNRFHIQKASLGSAGLGSPGGILVMPLSPSMAVLSFDRRVYQMRLNARKIGLLDHANDVVALNHLQVIHCNANLYFKEWNDQSLVEKSFTDVKDRRPERWYSVNNLHETAVNSNSFVAAEGALDPSSGR